MGGSRVQFFEQYLAILQYNMAYKALLLVKKEMCKGKGFARHNGTHYYFHLVDVSQKLLNAGIRNEDIITAALLHDITEDVLDTEGHPLFPIEKLAEMFNENVATMVELLTKKPQIDYKTNKKELQAYIKRILENEGAALIKCADVQHNFLTLMDATSEKRIRKAKEVEMFYIPFFKECRNLYPWYAAFFFEAKTNIEPQIQMIKEHYEEVQALKKQMTELKKQKQ